MRAAGQKTSTQSSATAQPAGRPFAEPSPLDPLLGLQQTVGNQAVLRLLRAGYGHAKVRSPSTQGFSSHAFGSSLQRSPQGNRSGLRVQRKCKACATGAPCSECRDEEEIFRKANDSSNGSASAPESASEPTSTKPTVLLVDDAAPAATGQMRKTEFLSLLRSAASGTAEETTLPGGGGTTGSTYLTKWIADAATKDSAHIEHALRKYVAGAAEATTAQDYVEAVLAQVQRGVNVFSSTGQITGVPPKLAKDLPDAAGKAVESEDVQFKKEEEGEGTPDDVADIRGELTGGHALDGNVRGEMEKAYGTSFSHVRVHTGAKAAELSDTLDARAFTIGNDIAFAAGEFKPGTLVGDALIAHELAHVMQQKSAGSSAASAKKGEAQYGSLEEDADLSAVGAMASIWGGVKEGLAGVAHSAIPRLRSGLKLQRCNGDDEKEQQAPPKTPAPPESSTGTPKTQPSTQPSPATPVVDTSICKGDNRKKVDEIIKTNPRGYDQTKVKYLVHKIVKGDTFTSLAKGLVDENTVTGTKDLSDELEKLNDGINASKLGNCVVLLKGWVSPASVAKTKRVDCTERIEKLKATPGGKDYKEWATATVKEKDNYEEIVKRVAEKKAGLFQGRTSEYAKLVEALNRAWVDPLKAGDCVALPVGWKDPNIGTLPTKPASGTLKKTDPAAQAIAVVYGEQTHTSKEVGASANFKEQQKYIWFSIRKRVEGAGYPPTLAAVLDPVQYHAIGGADYTAALNDLEANNPPTLDGVKNAKQIVLDNWTNSPPSDAGAGYFHWRKDSTPDKCLAAAGKLSPADKEKKEKECAWKWAKSIDIVGSVPKADGWLKRIRGSGDDPVGSMYIYPGNEK
jgi:hypothetical protein